MEVVSPGEMQWYMPRGGHRDEGVEFKTLFEGIEGEPVNYWFTLVQVRDRYHTPPHRHVFDQVRVMLKGGFHFGLQDQPEGTLGYFTEGTVYEQSCDNYSYHLLLQIEGASGQPYVRSDTMRAATERLKTRGAFIAGVYHPEQGEPVDGYEAIYTEATGIVPAYDTPRYERPVIIDPEAFRWTAVPGAPGVFTKALGSFTERGLTLTRLKVEAGCNYALTGPVLGFAHAGEGLLGDVPFRPEDGLRIGEGESAMIQAKETAEILLFGLPKPVLQ